MIYDVRLDWRTKLIISLLLVIAAVSFLYWMPNSSGPWDDVYTHYLPFWIAILLSLITTLTLREHTKYILVINLSLISLSIISLSFIWGPLYGPSDAWRILRRLRGPISPETIPYPFFHFNILAIQEVTGVKNIQVLKRIPALATLVGVITASAICDRHSNHLSYTSLVILVPALIFGLRPRPFTLAHIFLLFGLWLALSPMKKRNAALMTGLLALSPLFHPFIAFLIVIIIGGRIIYDVLAQNQLKLYDSVLPLICVSVVLTFHMAVVSRLGSILTRSIILSIFGMNDTGPSYQAGIAESATSSFRAVVEALSRGSYVLSLMVLVFIGIIYVIKYRKINMYMVLSLFSIAVTGMVFVLLAVLSPGGIGLFRVLTLVPILAFPAVAWAISEYQTNQSPSMSAAISILFLVILISGLGTVFVTPYTGSIEFTSNEKQVASANWIVELDPSEVVGSRSTFPIISGLYGTDTEDRVSAPFRLVESTRYGWMINLSRSGIYVIDEPIRAFAEVESSEGRTLPNQCLKIFEAEQDVIYNNGGVTHHKLSKSIPKECVVAN